MVRFLQTLSSDKVRGKRDIFITIHLAPEKEGNAEIYSAAISELLCAYGGYFPQHPAFSQSSYEATKDWIMS